MRLDPGGYAPYGLDACEVEIADARTAQGLEFAQTGFQLVDRASTVTDFYDPAQVVETYYEECKNLAMTLTGAHTAFTFDHLIREPGRQISGGGTDGSTQITAAEAGGGYGPETYSWHNIGIETYNVKSSPRHRWYYYPEMRSSEVLVFKSFDSAGGCWASLSACIV